MDAIIVADIAQSKRPPVRRADGVLEELIARDRSFAALMQHAQCGSEGAYSRLLQELPPVIGRMIRRQMPAASPTDQEDVLQEVLISIHAARAGYDPARPFMPWLKAIVVNRTIDFIRRQKRNAGQALTDDLAAGIADEASANVVARYDVVDALQKAISKLPAGQRSAIELLKLREMSLREAAATTGMSITALKASVHRAVRSLRVSLAPYQVA